MQSFVAGFEPLAAEEYAPFQIKGSDNLQVDTG